jgi:hypothetical protein
MRASSRGAAAARTPKCGPNSNPNPEPEPRTPNPEPRTPSPNPNQVQRLIKTDARRTFAEHRHARRLQPAVRRLLDAYSHRNPATGYCQSMNFIAASLLLHMPEPAAFWAFCSLLELALPDGLHASQLHGVTIELRLLDDLLSRQHGALLAHLRAAGVSAEMAASRWLMCVFVTVLPLRTAARLWDLMMLDAAAKGGASSVPLLACFALLQLHEARLLATPPHASALLPLLVQLPALASTNQREALLESVSRFVASAAYGTDLMQEQLAPLRAAHARVVGAELKRDAELSLLDEAELAAERDRDRDREQGGGAPGGVVPVPPPQRGDGSEVVTGGAGGAGGAGGGRSQSPPPSSSSRGRYASKFYPYPSPV